MENEQEDILAEIKQLERKLSWKEEVLQHLIFGQQVNGALNVMLVVLLVYLFTLPAGIIRSPLIPMLIGVMALFVLVALSKITRDRNARQFDILNDFSSLTKLGLRKSSDQGVLPVTKLVGARLVNAQNKLQKLQRTSAVVSLILVVIAGILILKLASNPDIFGFTLEARMEIILFITSGMIWLYLFLDRLFAEQIVQILEAGLTDIRLRNLRRK